MTVNNSDELSRSLHCKLCDWVARVCDWREAINHAWTKHHDDTIHDVFGPGLVIMCDYHGCPNAVASRQYVNLFAVAVASGWKLTADDSDSALSLGLDDKLTLGYEYCPIHSEIKFEQVESEG